MIGNGMSLRRAVREQSKALVRETVRAGLLAGLAMIPFAAIFRARGLRVNEYGRKTLALVISNEGPTAHWVLVFVQHLVISVIAAAPLVWLLTRIRGRPARILLGTLYGALFYALVNAWALPQLFGDPSPLALGFEVVYPSLVIHVVYGLVLGRVTRPRLHDERR
jgi:hypothetical protein